jgi:urea carboxylase
MFHKVLVLNRGEIACRIIRTVQRLGARAVAVHSDADANTRHVALAEESVRLGPAPAAKSYLDVDAVLRAIEGSGAEAVHPGYGFLSENADFAAAVEQRGVAFVGPTPEQMRRFAEKHAARALALELEVPLLPGTGLLGDAERAVAAADSIGYPVMLKSSAGGGGIGMRVCRNADALRADFAKVRGLARNNFGDDGVFLERYVERARHLEVQVFGDGHGRVVSLGERDCSAQRRHQKVIEETPAPRLGDATRRRLEGHALRLMQAVAYRSAGTVEFVYDDERDRFYFLEVNTRLQVEHGVTEMVTGVDLVEWMLRLAAGEAPPLDAAPLRSGHAIEARVYAEDPARNFRPSAGLLSDVVFPPEARVDGWVEIGTEVTAYYDPLLAKIIVHGENRDAALEKLKNALDQTEISGIETNAPYLAELVRDDAFEAGRMTTDYLSTRSFTSPSLEVLDPGTLTTVQDWPGRVGYWHVGIPPSGPMDPLDFRLANRVVGNLEGTAALEITLSGPTLRFAVDAVVALTGAALAATLDGAPVEYYRPHEVHAGQVLEIGALRGAGVRAYLAVRHGFDVPTYLGSASTFTLGGFGGHGGRALRRGDVLRLNTGGNADATPEAVAPPPWPDDGEAWKLGVVYGPHGAPDFFTPEDIATFFESEWEVHYNSARTGVRLIGPKPAWARTDGGEAGLHPSNIHDTAYAIGAVDYTGDMPIILGPDGPSLGGFVCPATLATAELWKLGQLKPSAKVRFVPLDLARASELEQEQDLAIASRRPLPPAAPRLEPLPQTPVLTSTAETDARPAVVYRPAGDKYLLVEYGPMVLDLGLRFRVHALMAWFEQERIQGVLELTPGIRSLQIHYDNHLLSLRRLLGVLERAEAELDDVAGTEVAARTVHLPLSWDDPATRLAVEKYVQSVRRDAPWTPDNLEFIRRINGLDDVQDVKRIVFDASYLVLGLGDVYLGAPVATPIDPRHRLVTTKYNPARTWTPENAVGIGGAYLCIYGMEGPGGYQFVGRTLQVYNRFKTTRHFEAGKPWLLRFFDQIRFYPVSAEELLEQRNAFLHGRFDVRIEPARFSLDAYRRFLGESAVSIQSFKARQQAAFEAERERWAESGQLNLSAEASAAPRVETNTLAPGAQTVESHVHGSVWQLKTTAGASVAAGDVLVVLECMKMEIAIEAAFAGIIVQVLVKATDPVSPGQALFVVQRG